VLRHCTEFAELHLNAWLSWYYCTQNIVIRLWILVFTINAANIVSWVRLVFVYSCGTLKAQGENDISPQMKSLWYTVFRTSEKISYLSCVCGLFKKFCPFPLTSLWPHLRCDVGLDSGSRGRVAELSLWIMHCNVYCYCIIMLHNSTSSSNGSVDMIVSISLSLALVFQVPL